MSPSSFDVVIPTYNNWDELQACLASLEMSTGPEISVFVCVDGSTDGTIEHLRDARFPFALRVLEHMDHVNHGRAAARNLAVPHLESSLLLMLDSDMRLAADALDRHADMLREAGRVSIGDVVYLNKTSNLWARYLTTRGKYKSPPGSEVGPLGFNTQNVALRTEDFVAVGGFDEALRWYGGEDTELALRLWKDRDLRFYYNASAEAMTIEGKTIPAAMAELETYGGTNLRLIRARHPGPPAPFWIDRLEAPRLRDRVFLAAMNPVTDRIVDGLLPHVPFGVQRRLIDYKVIRTIFRGYVQGVP